MKKTHIQDGKSGLLVKQTSFMEFIKEWYKI